MANLDQIVENLSTLTVIEAAELSKMLEEKWGVSAAAPVAVAGPAAAAGFFLLTFFIPPLFMAALMASEACCFVMPTGASLPVNCL